MLKTNSKQYRDNFARFLDDILIDEEGSGDTFKSRLQYLANRFRAEYGFTDNLRRYPNTQERLKEWLAGLAIGLPYTYCDIIQTAKVLHEDKKISALMLDKIQEQWFNHCAMMIIRICRKNGVEI